MRTFLLASCLFVLACDPSVARTVVIDPSAARVTMGSHEGSHVVAIVHDGVERPESDLEHANAGDSVKLRVVYRPGEEIPGEGVVRNRNSTAMMVAGAILLGAGVIAGASSGLCFLSGDDGFLDFRGACAFTLALAGAVLGVGPGIGLLVGGASAVAYVGDQPWLKRAGRSRVHITPIVSHNGNGVSLSVSF